MDLWNNSVGRLLATVLPNKSPEELFTIAEKYGLTVESTGDSRLQKMTDPKVFYNGDVVIPFPIIEAMQKEM